MLITRLLEKYGEDVPIFTDEILDVMKDYSRPRVYQLIDEAINHEKLIRYNRGVYYIPTDTILGKSILSIEDIIVKKYISDNDKIYGIGGKNILDLNFMITTQVPNTLEVITNNESRALRVIEICNQKVILRKSRTLITNENVYAYTILELFTNISVNEFKRSLYGKKKVIQYINQNNINLEQIYKLANYFPAKTMKNLINCEVINEIIRGQKSIY